MPHHRRRSALFRRQRQSYAIHGETPVKRQLADLARLWESDCQEWACLRAGACVAPHAPCFDANLGAIHECLEDLMESELLGGEGTD
jgi:hypothetical protein